MAPPNSVVILHAFLGVGERLSLGPGPPVAGEVTGTTTWKTGG